MGLMGEVGIHQIDMASNYINALPISVTGFSSLQEYKEDGRDVPDMAQCILEYPKGVTYYYDASLISSFENAKNVGYEVFYASGGTFLIRDQRAWMFKEPDARTLGWEGFVAGNRDAGIPVFALGGQSTATVSHALRHGAHGIAGIRGVI